MIIDCISDLHGNFPPLEGGDLLIVSGDLTARDLDQEHLNFLNWLVACDYRMKVFIGGNHDHFLSDNKRCGLLKTPKEWGVEYLCDSGVEFEGIKIWGTPWSLTFDRINPKCTAFTGDENLLDEKFESIPRDTNILITHTPPYEILDRNIHGDACGSLALRLIALSKTQTPNLKLNVFGHIHEQGGKKYETALGLKFVNCSYVNEKYDPVHKPVRIIL